MIDSKPVYIQIKSPQISISDAGFLNKLDSKKELMVFDAGNVVFKLTLNHLACLNLDCTTRADILSRLSLSVLPDTLLDDLLDSKPLKIKAKNCDKKATKDGFEERYKSEQFDIIYIVEKESTTFIDRKNKIFIKISEIKNE
jgi:hypothetical protein